MASKKKDTSPTPSSANEIIYTAKVIKFSVDDNNHLILTLDIPLPSPETIIGVYEAKKAGNNLDCRNVVSANSLTKLDTQNETINQKAKAGPDGVDRGRFVKQGDK